MIDIEMSALISGVMSSPLNDSWGQKIAIRALIIKGESLFQFTFFKNEQTFHENLTAARALSKLNECAPSFKQVQLYTTDADLHFLRNRKGVTCVRKAPTKKKLQETHNRSKQHLLPEGAPDRFLIGLGLMNPSGKIIPSMSHKFRQINRFLELVVHTLEENPPKKTLHIVDLGCGKAYLTFALYHYLHEIKKWDVKLCGIDLKSEVINDCRSLAKSIGYDNLTFKQQNIQEFKPESPVDIVVSLHACNIATDIALAKGVEWGASLLFAAPCCQHELFTQIDNPEMETLLRHGILKERFSALATDAIRAELLESVGYQTQVMEFIDLEHSPKNLLLRARFAPLESRQKKAWDRFLQLKKMLQAVPMLEKLLKL